MLPQSKHNTSIGLPIKSLLKLGKWKAILESNNLVHVAMIVISSQAINELILHVMLMIWKVFTVDISPWIQNQYLNKIRSLRLWFFRRNNVTLGLRILNASFLFHKTCKNKTFTNVINKFWKTKHEQIHLFFISILLNYIWRKHESFEKLFY